jgi:proteasome accessory factor A
MADPVELLGRFRQRAQARFGARDAETDAVLALWARVEAGLAGDLGSLVGLVDWVTKQHLLETFRASEGLAWDDPWLEAQDLEYHHLDPARSLGLALADLNGPWAAGLDDPSTLERGPADTRAGWRTEMLRRLAAGKGDATQAYEIDWDRIELGDGRSIDMADPFQRGAKPTAE